MRYICHFGVRRGSKEGNSQVDEEKEQTLGKQILAGPIRNNETQRKI